LVKFGHTISDRLGAIEFRDFCFVDGCKPVTTRKYLVQLNACYEWAMECGLVDYNPFSGLAKQLKVRSESKPDPFTREEAQAILEAFRTHKRYSY
jgi:integrase